MQNIVVVKPDSLASILVVNRELEEEAEAFRLQPNVNFVIDFDNYVEFIDKELNMGKYLALPMKVLKIQVKNYKTNKSKVSYIFLKRAFFKDLCLGLMKELYFAEKNRKCASIITHSIEGEQGENSKFIDKMFNEHITYEMEIDLLKRISQYKYPIATPISDENMFIFKYALVLDYCAEMGITNWSFNYK